MKAPASAANQATTLEIIAFHLGDQQFCIKTTSIREIRGWAAATPLPHSPPGVVGVMNLRGSVIPIIDLAARLGVRGTVDSSRAAIVVAEVGKSVVGLVVDQVSDILSLRADQIQPVPDLGVSFDPSFSHGIIPLERGMVCFLNLDHMFANLDETASVGRIGSQRLQGRFLAEAATSTTTIPSQLRAYQVCNIRTGPIANVACLQIPRHVELMGWMPPSAGIGV